MQLRKDDVKSLPIHGYPHYIKVLDLSRFQQVRKFYDDYKDDSDLFHRKQLDLWSLFYHHLETKSMASPKGTMIYIDGEELKKEFRNWLFPYCFKQGLE
ncbi:MAG: hypothetical protein IMZ58_07755 [Thermoplasmata archaeon]|nr:hypothetical protein [Thermoplasmata archaeon]